MKFNDLQLNAEILEGIQKAGFTTCTEVQEETFRKTLKGQDVLVQSQTGTGKTAAFLISIFQLMLTNDRVKGGKALIIAPTRELADQIEKEATLLGSFLPFKIASFYGGVGYGQQEKALRDGVDIIIGTPGRLLDFNESGKLPFNDVRILVIDEADRLFDMGFLPDLKRMLKKMPAREERLTFLFSATLGSRVSHLAWEYMNEPAEIAITPENVTVEEITQELYHVTKPDRFRLLLGIMKHESPESVIIFTNTKHEAEEVSNRLELNGYQSKFIIGDLPQKKRLAVIESIKSGLLKVLVATDVAARGLHIQDLELVVNYDLPEDSENYVHRIGRTARAGKTGKAISLACEACVYNLDGIEKLIGKKIPSVWPENELYVDDASAGMRIHRLRDEYPSRDRRGGKSGRSSSDRAGRLGRSGSGVPRERIRQEHSRKPTGGTDAVRAAREKPVHGRDTPASARKSDEKKPGQPSLIKKHNIPRNTHRSAEKPNAVRSESGKAAQRPDHGKGSLSSRDRLEYYRQKYGETFKPAGGSEPPSPEKDGKTDKRGKPGFLDRILGIFKPKK